MNIQHKYLKKISILLLFINAIIVYAQFPNYSKTYNYSKFLQGNISGGGSVTVSVNNNVLTLNFSASWGPSTYLKQGLVATLDNYSATLPNTELPINAGTYFADKGYKFYLINNKIYIYGVSPMPLTSFTSSLTVNLLSPVAISQDTVNNFTTNNVQNKIVSTEYLTDQGKNGNKNISVMYYDGLGRELQQVKIGFTPQGKDFILPYEYDVFGRKAKDYLPIPTMQSNGFLVSSSNINSLANTAYNNEPAFSETIFDDSPLNRVVKQAAPGADWQKNSGHEQKFGYEVNTLTDNIKKYSVTTTLSGDIYNISFTNATSNYAAGLLTKKIAKDEDWTSTDGNNRTTEEYTNKEGQTILVRKYIDGTKADTYYVYDIYGNLTYVISPLASANTTISQTALDNLCYQYKYDKRNRLVEKKLPGNGWEYMLYDKQNRLVATQDANMRINSQWLFTKYDNLGRVLYTGITTGSTTRATEQTLVDAKTNNNEAKSAAVGFTSNGLGVYYTNSTAYPTSISTLLSVNYYDTYPVGMPTTANQIQGANRLPLYSVPSNSVLTTKGLSTASFLKNIEVDSWAKIYNFYDEKSRIIGTHSYNYLGGYTKVESSLDFVGVPQYTYTYHKRLSTDAEILIKERFVYDNQNRLLRHYHQVNAQPEELLAENTYNEIGQLINEKVGNNIQSIDYAYNIRGWLTSVNNPKNLGTRLFGYSINYNNPLEGLSTPKTSSQDLVVKPKYNGNIAEVLWNSSSLNNPNNELKIYGYVYDDLNRLLAGFYQPNNNKSSNEHSEILTYDLNGNIETLNRTAYLQGNIPVLIDDLTYDYTGTGNRLNKVTDASGNSSGFEGAYPMFGDNGTIPYDANGNMTSMPGKNIRSINYNYLNLPKSISLNYPNNSNTSYTYRADGVKVNKVHTSTTVGYRISTTTKTTIDYLDGFQYSMKETTTEDGGGIKVPILMPLAMEQEAFLDVPLDSGEPLVEEPQPILQFFPTAEGFYDYQKKLYIYQYKDHLGNTRLSYAKNPTTGSVEVQDENDYYPFGMNHLKTGVSYFGTGTWNNYKYIGKELQETGMYDYGARFYMPDLGRFGTQDPMQVFDMWQSSYAYANNNPVLYQDEYGLGILNVIGNIFKRTIHFVTNIFNNECRCSQSFPGESIADAWMRPDFPSNGGGRSKKPSPTTSQSKTPDPIASKPAGILPPDFSSNISDINPSAMPSPNVGIDDITPSPTRPPLPTNVEFDRSIYFQDKSIKLYDEALSEKTLYDLISTLQEHADLKVIISGNTGFTAQDNNNTPIPIDGKPSNVGNLKLGRAKAIMKLLMKRGIDPNRIILKKGKTTGNASTTFKLIDKK